MAKVIFRLTVEGKTPSTWEIPQTNVMGTKEGKGKKFINYYPGEDSCFVEDIFAKNKDLKPGKVPLFKFNSNTGFTELSVDAQNLSMINYLKTHPWYKVKFDLFSKDAEAKANLAQYDNIEKALELIKGSDEMKVKAIAMAVFGLTSFYKTFDTCAAELKGKAIKDPKSIIDAMESTDYETKYVSGLAFVSGIIKLNATHSAIVWADNDGLILHIAQGENGLDKLSEFLRKASTESEILLQEFQSRLDKQLESKATTQDLSNVLSEKDREIAELKAQLANQSEGSQSATTTSTEEEKLLVDARKKYTEKTGKTVPFAYNKNLEWINKKLQD